MRVLLSEGSGLTSRQVAGRLARLGHTVGVLSSDDLALTRFTKATRAWHDVPKFGADPLGWLNAAIDVYRANDYDVLFPTQEQVTVLAAFPDRLAAAGVATAVPPFAAVRAVQDKLSATRSLARLGLPQPDTALVTTADQLRDWTRFPAFVKTQIGTASGGVWKVSSGADLAAVAAEPSVAEAFRTEGGVLVQQLAEGPLAMVQSVFDQGRLIAFHANERTRLGARGGASHKTSVALPEARSIIEALGADLGWHGGLSADIVLTPDGPQVIDVNPRLVEPGNGLRAGVDLVAAMLAVVGAAAPEPLPDGRPGVRTHQLGLAIIGAAEQGRGRRGIWREVVDAARHRASYADSVEELSPMRGDWRTALPFAAAAVACTIRPASWSWFSSGSVDHYALTPAGWRTILAATDRAGMSGDSAG